MFNQCVAIWFKEVGVADFQNRGQGTLADWIGISVTEVGDDYVKSTMAVDHRTKQPMGILNGGASVALAESICSAAGNFCVDPDLFRCVGLEINANHLRPAKEGQSVIATCRPLHLGRKTQVWETRIESAGKLTCICRMTLAVIDKKEL